jgi:putative membrane protein
MLVRSMTRQRATRWAAGGIVALGAILVVVPLLLGGGAMGWGGMAGSAWGPMSGGPMMDGTGGAWGPMSGGSMTDGASGAWWAAVAVLGRLLVLAAVVGGGYLLYRAITGATPGTDEDPALEELRAAYARGDLTEAEYDRRRERLGSD